MVEVMFAMAIVGVLIVALYGAIGTSASWMRLCQENETATQIMGEKLDTLRLYNWNQITLSNGTFFATNFTVGIDPLTNSTAYYTGRVVIANALINSATESYKTNLKQVTINLTWRSGTRMQNRTMSTFVTSHGIQSYVNLDK